MNNPIVYSKEQANTIQELLLDRELWQLSPVCLQSQFRLIVTTAAAGWRRVFVIVHILLSAVQCSVGVGTPGPEFLTISCSHKIASHGHPLPRPGPRDPAHQRGRDTWEEVRVRIYDDMIPTTRDLWEQVRLLTSCLKSVMEYQTVFDSCELTSAPILVCLWKLHPHFGVFNQY